MYATLLVPCFTASAVSRRATNDNAGRLQRRLHVHQLVAEIAQDNHAASQSTIALPADLDQALDRWLLADQRERAR
jgi:hypothetical protein